MTFLPSNVGIQKEPSLSKVLDVKGDTNIDSSTASTSPTTGAFTVLGGVGISGDLYVGGSVNFSSSFFNNITVRGTVLNTPSSATATIWSSTVVSEANPRFYVDATGNIFLGAGGVSTNYDVQLSRTGPSSFGITGNTIITGTLTSTGSASFGIVNVAGSLNATGSAVFGGTVSSSNGYIGNFTSSTSALLQSNVSSAPTFSIDSSGLMNWNNTPMSLTSSSDPDFNGSPVFTALNCNGRVAFKNSTSSIVSGGSSNFVYSGSHQFVNGLSSAGDLSTSSSLKVKSSVTGFTRTSVDPASISFYDTTGGASSTLSFSGPGQLSLSGALSIAGSLTSSSFTSTGTVSSAQLTTTGTTLLIDRSAQGSGTVPNCGLRVNNSTSSNYSSVSTNSTDTGWSLRNTATGTIDILPPSTGSATLTAVGAQGNTFTLPNATGTIVLQNSVDTLSNKVIEDVQVGSASVSLPGSRSIEVDVTGISSLTVTAIAGTADNRYIIEGFKDTQLKANSSKVLVVTNLSSADLRILNESASSAPSASRVRVADDGDVIVWRGSSVTLTYQGGLSRWVPIGPRAEKKTRRAFGAFLPFPVTTNFNAVVEETFVFTNEDITFEGSGISYSSSTGLFTVNFSCVFNLTLAYMFKLPSETSNSLVDVVMNIQTYDRSFNPVTVTRQIDREYPPFNMFNSWVTDRNPRVVSTSVFLVSGSSFYIAGRIQTRDSGATVRFLPPSTASSLPLTSSLLIEATSCPARWS
jgi:hypothetical protein